jgi:hypothetical protein
MKLHLYFCIGVLAGLCTQAQTTFTTNSLPCHFGEYNCSYYSTNVDVTAMLALATTNSGPTLPGQGTNVAQYWNFSHAQQPYEIVYRADIIAPQDGANAGQFPDATYAEQDTLEPDNIIGWEYYGFTGSGTNSGRLCYGLDAPEDVPITEYSVFVPPTVDIPSSVQFGQTWSGSCYWLNVYLVFLISNNYTFSATADAFGTLVLPEIGAVPALRVHEVDSYASYDVSDPPRLVEISTDQYYYWLVPGLGVAVQVQLLGNYVADPVDLPYTNTVQRMFYASYFTNTAPMPPPGGPTIPPFPTDLYIQKQSDSVVLNWSTLSNAVNCRIDYKGSLASNWQTLGYTNSTSWTDTMTAAQRFYRVVGIP